MYLRYTCEYSASLNTQEVDFPVRIVGVLVTAISAVSIVFGVGFSGV